MSIKITDYILCGDLNKLISSISKFVYKTGKIRCIVVEEKECVAGPNPDEKLIDLYQKGFVFCSNLDYKGKEECSVEPLYLETELFEDLSAYPRILTLHKKMTYSELKKIIYIYARKYITTPFDSKEFKEEIEKVTDDTGYSEDNYIKMCNEEFEKIFNAKEKSEDINTFMNDLLIEDIEVMTRTEQSLTSLSMTLISVNLWSVHKDKVLSMTYMR